MMCFLLQFKVILYILRNEYPTFKDSDCIPNSYRYCDTHIKYIFIGFDNISGDKQGFLSKRMSVNIKIQDVLEN